MSQRSKLSNFNSPSLSSNLMTRIAVSQANGSSASKKLRTELRRVMSDRVLKITRCSQQQTVDKIKQRTDLNNSKNLTDLNDSVASNSQIEHSSSTPNFSLNQSNLNNTLPNQNNEANTSGTANSETAAEGIIKIPTFTEKTELIEYIKKIYDKTIENNTSLGQSVQEISNVIKNYSKQANLDTQQTVSEILKENMIQTNLQLKQRYKGDETSERLKIEGQIQVLLTLEEYINVNTCSNKVKVDDDFIWEAANSVRWLSQMFKEKFKIEKFLFGEIYPTFFPVASELIVGLMEELGYDKDDNLDDTATSSNPASDSNSLVVTPNKSPSIQSRLARNENNYSQFNDCSTSPGKSVFNSLKDDVNGTPGFSKVNALFEDYYQTNEPDTYENDEIIQSQKNEEKEKDDDLLDDFKKKKAVNRFSSFSAGSSTGRSIVVQSKKRMRLKIRSPCKEPTPTISAGPKRAIENVRKSPRVKDKQILESTDDDNNKKRPRTYLITDTPDHKQNTTIIRTKQEKIRKRFSFQPLNPNSNTNTNALPVIPDTPVKNDNRFINNAEAPIGVVSSRCSELFKTKIYSSPSKMFSPQKKTSSAPPNE